MKKIKLHADGPEVAPVVLGVMTWGENGKNLGTQEIRSRIDWALDYGFTTFDHADIYGGYTTEAAFGAALDGTSSQRQRMQLITKCGIKLMTPNRPHHKIKSYDTSIEHIIWSVEQSLKNLKTDYLDLLLIHRPSPLMHPDDLALAFHQLKESGKVLHFGVSNFTPSQFAMVNSRIPLVTNQIEASIRHLDPFFDGTFDQCLQWRIRPMAWSPLGGGALVKQAGSAVMELARELAAGFRSDVQPDQILLAWLLRHPTGIVPVIGTTRIERMQRSAEALRIELTREQWFALLEAARGQRVP